MTPTAKAVEIIHDTTCRDNQHDGPESEYPCVELAREVLKAGQHEPRTITTVEELHALPVGTVVQVNDGSVAKRVDSDIYDGLDWMFVGSDEYREPSEFEFMFPATPLTAQPAISAEQVAATARALVRHNNPGMGDDLVVKDVDDSAEFLAVQGRYEAWKSEVDGTHDALIWALAEAGLTVAGESDG